MKKLLTVILSLVVLGFFAGCGDSDENVVKPVFGFYVVTEGTQHITTSDGDDYETDITGAYLSVDQNDDVISSVLCLGKLDNMKVDCSDTVLLTLGWFGPEQSETNDGDYVFNDDGTLDGSFEGEGSIPWVEFTYTNDATFKAELDEETWECPTCSDNAALSLDHVLMQNLKLVISRVDPF